MPAGSTDEQKFINDAIREVLDRHVITWDLVDSESALIEDLAEATRGYRD
jgi:hypothetical protein